MAFVDNFFFLVGENAKGNAIVELERNLHYINSLSVEMTKN